MSAKPTVKLVHRYVSLVFAALWLFQAATGVLVVFRWELDDARVQDSGVPVGSMPFDRLALGAKLDALASQPGTRVSSVWSSGRKADRFDITYTQNGHDHSLRVNGAGAPLRDLTDGTVYDRLSDLHMALMQGDIGRWFLGLSGLVLLSNLILGLILVCRGLGLRTSAWLKALSAPRANLKALPMFTYGWHRTLGLWLCLPAFVTITAGVFLAYDDPIAAVFKAEVPTPLQAPVVLATPIRPSIALDSALRRFPGATLSGFSFPGEHPWYKVRLHAAGEMPRIWGMTTVFISAQTGEALSQYDAREPHAPARFLLDLAYPLHTGQIAGLFGRGVQLLIGLWLMAMIGLGVTLWWGRRRQVKKSRN